MAATMINGVTYDWHSIEVIAKGVSTPALKDISYKEAGKRTKVYGTPRNAVGRTGGKSEPEASMTMFARRVRHAVPRETAASRFSTAAMTVA